MGVLGNPASRGRAVGVMLFLLATVSAPCADHADVSENQVKAAFLYNFTKFIEWPAPAASSSEEPFLICVLGKDPFGSDLDTLVKDKTALGHRIEVRRYTHVGEVQHCQILFISSSEAHKYQAILKALDGARVLTVSDAPQFLEAGGMLNLILLGSRVVFEVNARAAEREGFRFSSKLLQLAVKNLRAGTP